MCPDQTRDRSIYMATLQHSHTDQGLDDLSSQQKSQNHFQTVIFQKKIFLANTIFFKIITFLKSNLYLKWKD